MKLVIFDGNSILYRAFFALPELTTSNNIPTNAIYGFVNVILKYLEQEKPDYVAVAFDKRGREARKSEYEEYKANRKPMPDNLQVQIPYVREILYAFNIPIIEFEGYEADDVIGSLVNQFKNTGLDIVIITGDRDTLQLLDKNVVVKIVSTKFDKTVEDLYTVENVKEKYGVWANQVPDYKALVGDQSDNIPGVKGIGEKSAQKLLEEYSSLEEIYQNLDKIKSSIREKLEAGKDMAFLSKRLATIVCDLPLNVKLEDLRTKEWNKERLYEILVQLEFKSIIKRLGLSEVVQFEFVQQRTDIPDVEQKELESISQIRSKEIPLMFVQGEKCFYLYDQESNTVFITSNKLLIEEILKSDTVKIMYDLKNIFHQLNLEDTNNIKNCEDVMIASYVLDSTRSSYELETLFVSYLNTDIEAVKKDKKIVSVVLLKRLWDELLRLIDLNSCQFLYENIERPLIPVLYEMEKTGFKVDRDALIQYTKEIENKILKLETQIYQIAGEWFNINSPKQLSYILFEKLKLPVIKKTKTGYSTDAEVLEELFDKHEIVPLILDYRMYTKILTTYCQGLLQAINPSSGRVHTTFIQTGTATGRLASSDPNLQNIPVKYDEGKLIRKVFVPEGGHVLIDADYSQIELRILAHISEDERLISAFKNNVDIHSQTAAEVFGVDIADVTPEMRSQAKAVNFGIVYGISDYGLARDIKISRKEAAEFINKYFERYPKVKEYLDNTVKFARDNGFVLTLFNRKRYIKDIKSTNRNLRGYAERIAMNSPIQGSAADIMKLAMIKVYQKLKENNLKSKIILQVHDELLIEAPYEEKDIVKEIVKREMENAVALKVPLVVEVKEGLNWYETK
ncbi:DNA polymerase I [Caldicellulosiruptor bescii]|uniref:DNA polymerase I n=2 Tax=Caldicellulosiruptor bescii TaxID=31899 RepID=DPO1_CALBD|nr:DNA polymerase I [Caldicellulosiruptor bescii]Q59156.2 RecName: Full=DNA polymerase I; Short=Pol I [Caldicellulosiruptor bescii DSM 6725]ACM60539.1 DNA polymerase I [Caldicellulosiruptor bescii DSM 6725]PBC87950.1 DNA polymerase I [Caldicellulosiruptor bescii]PBC90882.1 DNA polymerase I [Caldicellulosiruptor bescii]PBD03686.1 DNA polymerase I [Caldicellulosiruptor bescii]PBD06680.1 DNA polymerase I [Caldicellulosiruptor bescii]